MSKIRFPDLDAARGLMVLILVFRHAYNETLPADNAWYEYAVTLEAIYRMPAFFFITGMILSAAYRPIESVNGYLYYCKKRLGKYFLWFFLFGIIIFCGKFVMQNFIPLDRHVMGLQDFKTLLLTPRSSSFASYVWFLQVLSLYAVIWPFIYPLIVRLPFITLAVSVGIAFIPATELFSLDYSLAYLSSTVAGAVAWQYRDKYVSIIDRGLLVFIALFAMVCIAYLKWPEPALALVLAFSSFPVIHGLARCSFIANNYFVRLGTDYMLPVYLMNTMFINPVRGVIQLHFSWDGHAFLVILPILMLAGLYGPIIVTMVWNKFQERFFPSAKEA